jgi:lysozyme family protein
MSEPMESLKMCELLAKGLLEEIDQRSDVPAFVCGKCGAKANKSEYLHNPRPLAKKKSDSFWG